MRMYRKKAVHHLFDRTFSRWGRVPGRWVPWCVAHDAAKGGRTGPVWNVCEWRMGNPWPRGKCVWHPQGAFIPEVADDA